MPQEEEELMKFPQRATIFGIGTVLWSVGGMMLLVESCIETGKIRRKNATWHATNVEMPLTEHNDLMESEYQRGLRDGKRGDR